MMRYWEIQGTAVDLLKAHASLAAIASTILADDGQYPKTPGIEDAINQTGIGIVVTEPIETDQDESALSGVSGETVRISVIIRYRSGDLTHWHALEYVRQALQGKPAAEENPNLKFQAWRVPWENDGKIGGDNRIVAHFTVGHILTP